jgi:hypothetical protein
MTGTFRPEHLRAMYKLSPMLNLTHNAEFLEGFKKKECEQYAKRLSDLIKDWVSHPGNSGLTLTGSIQYLPWSHSSST